MACTILGLFDNVNEVTEVQRELTALGIPAASVHVTRQAGATGQATSGAHYEDKGFWESLKEMFTGDEEATRDVDYYSEGARRGGILVSVDAPDAQAERVADVLRQHNAVNIDERAAEWQKSGWKASTAAPAAATQASRAAAATTTAAAGADVTGRAAIPVTQEELAVGKRTVDRGGIRIVRRVTEKPVEASVNLREEHVNVERRTVDRPLTGAEANEAFSDKVVEVTESAEEAVAAKKARVVEEVLVDKNVQERTQKVQDTVRRTDVQVERLPGQGATERTEKVTDTATTKQADRTKTGAEAPGHSTDGIVVFPLRNKYPPERRAGSSILGAAARRSGNW